MLPAKPGDACTPAQLCGFRLAGGQSRELFLLSLPKTELLKAAGPCLWQGSGLA